MRNKRILITGASGFIGLPCLKKLEEQGYEIHAVSSRGKIDNAVHVICHQCDLLDLGAVSELCKKIKATHLLHLAWYVEPGYKISEENIKWVHASMELLKAFHSNGGYRATFAGTCFEYDLNSGHLSENTTPLSAHTVYGASKHLLHELVKAYSVTAGLSFAWARIFYLYGPRENPQRLLASVINSLINGKRAACTEGHQILDFLHVYDVASALVAILDSEITGAVNVGSGVPVSVRELVYTTAELMAAGDLVDFGARPMPENEPLVIVANTDKLKNEIGWQSEFDLSSGLLNTIEWWRGAISKQE